MATILLVDENPLRASMRKSLLEGCAPQIVRAVDAADAFCQIESEDFSQRLLLVLVEHAMQAMPGPEFVEELRARLPRVAVLVLSGNGQAEREYAGISGVSFTQTKSPQELRALVSRLVTVGEKQYA